MLSTSSCLGPPDLFAAAAGAAFDRASDVVGEIAAELAAKGLRGNIAHRTGVPISKQAWIKICRSPVYGGLICEQWTDYEFVRAKFDGPIRPDEWYRLQQVLDDRNTVARRLPRQQQHADFPLRGFLRCPKCGETVRGYAAVKKNGRRFPYYDCRTRPVAFASPSPRPMRGSWTFLANITPSPKLVEAFRRVVLEVWEEQYRKLNSQSNDLQNK